MDSACPVPRLPRMTAHRKAPKVRNALDRDFKAAAGYEAQILYDRN